MSKVPSIGILAHTAISDDPRVRRQIEAFEGEGWNVLAFGASGGRSMAPTCEMYEVVIPTADRSFAGRLRRLSVLSQLRVLPVSAESVYWQLPERYIRILEAARPHKPDVWLVNDWMMLPIAASLAISRGIPFIYDMHEFAYDEFPDDWKWRYFMRPLVRSIEERYIRKAAAICCVSDGIAHEVRRVYALKCKPSVIRNLPQYEPHAYRPTENQVQVLYHGLVTKGRGLEVLVQSVPKWIPHFHLTIRGPGTASYIDDLRKIAHSCGASDRVRFVPPVAFSELITSAASFDLGLFVLPEGSAQSRFALPNKIFEYSMAGLGLCVSDLPEMARIVNDRRNGVLIERCNPDAVAVAINSIDREQLNNFKRNSLAAAKELCWEKEKSALLSIAEGTLRQHISGNEVGMA